MSCWEQRDERLLVSKWKLVSSKNNSHSALSEERDLSQRELAGTVSDVEACLVIGGGHGGGVKGRRRREKACRCS